MATIVLMRNALSPDTRELIPIKPGTRIIDWLQVEHPNGFGMSIRFFVNDMEKPLDDLDYVIGVDDVVVISMQMPLDESPLIASARARADIGDPLTADLAEIERSCIRILDAASVPYNTQVPLAVPRITEESSREDYALRILSRLHLLRQFMSAGNARIAADYALELGYYLNEARLGPLALKAASSAWGRTKSKRVRESRTDRRNTEIVRNYYAKIKKGTPRKAALEDLKKETGLSNRQLRSIVPPARKK